MRTLAALLLLSLGSPPSYAVAPRHRKKKPAAPAVSVRARAAALAHISRLASETSNSIENSSALVPFFVQLSRPPATGALHVLHYGDSHTASDDWANTIRQGLQARFGSGGPGFALAGRPYRGYRRYDLSGTSSGGWFTGGTVGHPGDGRNGLGGLSIETQSPGRTVSLTVDCSQLNLFYLRQPGGGQLEFSLDGAPVEMISTEGSLSPGYFRYKPLPGSHQYSVRTVSPAPVKLFGWVAENQTGVTYETLGINGAQASMLLDWDETILAGHLAERDPALIVIAYGTNEAFNPRWDAASYRGAFAQVIQRFHRSAPQAGILVIGPPDCQIRHRQRRMTPPRLAEVTAVQRAVALEQGCAFWDWRAKMGGPGSVVEWVRAGLGQPDYVHLTGAGYQVAGRMLLDSIMDQYNRFLAVKSE